MATDPSFSLRRELRRKSLHLAMGIAPLGLIAFPRWWPVVIYAGTAVALVLDTLRLRNAAVGEFFMNYLGHFARSHESRHYLGVTWFLVACTACTLLFDRPTAAAALLFVVVGDAAAAIVGRGWGRIRIGSKSVEGTAACFLSCALVGWPLIEMRAALLAGSAVAAVVELLPLPVDDNLRVPLASAAAMWGVYALS